MSISVSGSHHRIAGHMQKGLREAGGAGTASAGTAGAASTASGTSIDSTGSATSSAMMAFLARLSGSLDGDPTGDGGAGPDGTFAPGAPPSTGAAGPTAAASTSGALSASTLIGALDSVLQSLTASIGTSSDTSLSAGDPLAPPPADGSTGANTTDGTSAATAGQIQAFTQALQAYAAQASSPADS